MRCLVTGANGFLGRHVADYLQRTRGLDVAGLVRKAGAALPFEVLAVDILDREAVRRALETVRPECVFHFAGEIRGLDAAGFRSVNVVGTENVLSAAAKTGSAVLLPGSVAELGATGSRPVDESHPLAPASPYGISKVAQVQAGRLAAAASGIPVFIARLFSVIGPGQEAQYVCADLAGRVARLSERDKLTVHNPDAVRDFLDVRDACRAFWDIVTKAKPAEIYHVCSGEGRSFRQLAETLLDLRGLPASVIEEGGADPAATPYTVGDPSKIQSELGWKPEHDLRSTLEWILAEQGENGVP